MAVTSAGKPWRRFEVKVPYLVAADVVGILAAFVFSLVIRYEAAFAIYNRLDPGLPLLLLALFVRVILNFSFGLYSQMWRHASVREVVQVVKAVSLGSFILFVVNFVFLPWMGISQVESRGVLVIDWILNLAYLGGSRLVLRVALSWLYSHDRRVLAKITSSRRVLIMGAGNAGAITLRLIKGEPELGFIPVGFVDDDESKQSLRIQDIPVLGTREDIPRLVREHRIDQVIIAISIASARTISEIRHICASVPVPTRVLPSIRDLLSGEMTKQQLRDLRLTVVESEAVCSARELSFHDVLVTGGAGFIGSNFVRYMLEAHPDYRIVVYDKLTYAGNLDNLLGLADKYGERYVFIRGDICDAETVTSVFEEYKVDAIVNFAAETAVDRSLMTPGNFVHTNVYGTYVLLDVAHRYGALRFHQVSTDEVYGQVLKGTFKETDPLETRSPYSASKASADLTALAYYTSFGLPVTITRGSNNVGPYQYPEKAVPLFTTNALDNEPLPIYGDGLYVRDYQYTLDHCRGIDMVLHKGVSGEIYNLGSGSEMSATELAKRICDILQKSHSLIRLVKDRPGQDRRYSLDCTKIRALGWEPEFSLDEALEMTVQWYIENEWWWRKIKSGEYRIFYEKQYRERLDKAMEGALIG